MRALVLSLLAVLAAGCTTADLRRPPWARPGAGIQEVTAADLACRRQASLIAPEPETVVGGLADVAVVTIAERRRLDAYEHCMESAGFRRPPAAG